MRDKPAYILTSVYCATCKSLGLPLKRTRNFNDLYLLGDLGDVTVIGEHSCEVSTSTSPNHRPAAIQRIIRRTRSTKSDRALDSFGIVSRGGQIKISALFRLILGFLFHFGRVTSVKYGRRFGRFAECFLFLCSDRISN